MKTDLLDFLHAKLGEAEKALAAREDMARVFRSGDDASWAAAAEAHPLTRGNPLTEKERLREADAQERIAKGCRREVEMFKAVIAELSKSETAQEQ